jgi:hypothetical protein
MPSVEMLDDDISKSSMQTRVKDAAEDSFEPADVLKQSSACQSALVAEMRPDVCKAVDPAEKAIQDLQALGNVTNDMAVRSVLADIPLASRNEVLYTTLRSMADVFMYRFVFLHFAM